MRLRRCFGMAGFVLTMLGGAKSVDAATVLMPIPGLDRYGGVIAGPVFDGGAVAWIDRQHHISARLRLVMGGPDGSQRVVETYPAQPVFDIPAQTDELYPGDGLLAISRGTPGYQSIGFEESRIGPAEGPTHVYGTACHTNAECASVRPTFIFGVADQVIGVADQTGSHLRGPGVDRDISQLHVAAMKGAF